MRSNSISIEEWLLTAFQPRERQRVLEEAAEGDEEAQRLIAASRALKDALGSFGGGRESEPSLDAIAFLAASRQADEAELSPTLLAALENLEARILADPERRALLDEYAARARHLDGSLDASAHFRKLADDSPARPRVFRLGRWPLVAASLLVGLSLFAWGAYRSDSGLQREALSQLSRADVLRSGSAEFEQALNLAAASRDRRWGLWPVYDSAALARAEILLEQGAESPEASLLLARVLLLQDKREVAIPILQPLLERSDDIGRDAKRLIDLMGEPR